MLRAANLSGGIRKLKRTMCWGSRFGLVIGVVSGVVKKKGMSMFAVTPL